MSAGYLWNAKNKQISGERGKEKFRGNFNLNDWRFATIGELRSWICTTLWFICKQLIYSIKIKVS